RGWRCALAHDSIKPCIPVRPCACRFRANAACFLTRRAPAWRLDGVCMNTTLILTSLAAVQRAILANESNIESLDRAIGDGDHFINVKRGCDVLTALAPELREAPPWVALNKIGLKLLGTIGGASGPLIS